MKFPPFYSVYSAPYSVSGGLTMGFLWLVRAVLVRIKIFVLDEFFKWLSSATPYSSLTHILRAFWSWCWGLSKISKVLLALVLFFALSLVISDFEDIYDDYITGSQWGLYNFCLALLFVLFLIDPELFLAFLEKIIERGEFCLSDVLYYNTRDVVAFIQLQDEISFELLTTLNAINLPDTLSFLIVCAYKVVAYFCTIAVMVALWSYILHVYTTCVILGSPSGTLVIALLTISHWFI